ncbi:MAG: hypothetical protein LRY55_08935 [Leadbetterella sp.]|nr:hypothetical protein [Leadbetterella sp.]
MRLVKQIWAVGFAGLILFRSAVIPVVFLEYELRKEYIIQNFCINKDKILLKCDGKCYLAKKLNETREKEAKSALVSFLFSMESNYVPPVFRFENPVRAFREEVLPLCSRPSFFIRPVFFDFFRPPRA